MTRKEIEQYVVDELYAGKTYQETYDTLNARFPKREIDLARIISQFVSNRQRQLYQVHSIVMMVLLFAVIAFRAWNGFALWVTGHEIAAVFMYIFMGLYVYLLIGVIRWDMRVYRFIGGLSILGLFSVVTRGAGGTIEFNPFSILPMALVIMGFYMHSQLGGKFTAKGGQYKEPNGQIRAKYEITFRN